MPVLTLLVEQIFAPVPGGTGRYSREVAAAVGASVPADWRVRSVAALHRDVSGARVPGVQGPVRLPVEARLLARLWDRGLPPTLRGTVAHALTPLAPARLRAGQALVVTVHDAVPYTHPGTLTPRGASWHRRMIERAARTAGAIVVPTEAVLEQLRAAGIGGRMVVVGEGTAAALSAEVGVADIEAARARLRLPARYLLTVGTLEPRKGLDVLLDAVAADGNRQVHLAVVGQRGWGDSDVAQEAERRGLSDRVHVLGRIPDADLAAVLAGAAASVVPSRSEGFGLPLLEAMARGVPVIHSDAPALVEVAGGAGLIVPVGDVAGLATAIAEVLDHPEKAAGMAAAGRSRALRYSWDSVATQLWALYREMAP